MGMQQGMKKELLHYTLYSTESEEVRHPCAFVRLSCNKNRTQCTNLYGSMGVECENNDVKAHPWLGCLAWRTSSGTKCMGDMQPCSQCLNVINVSMVF